MNKSESSELPKAAPASEPTRAFAYRVRGRDEWHVCSSAELEQVMTYGGVEYMELVNATPGYINKVQCVNCGASSAPVAAFGSVACCGVPSFAAVKVPYDPNEEAPVIDVRAVALRFGNMTQSEQDEILKQLKNQPADYYLSTIKSGDQ